jgi:hypothetical protein
VIAGIALTVAIWQVGFVASITSFAMAAAAVWLYAKGAGSPPRKGVIPLVALVVVGVLISIPACIVSDGVAGVQEAFPGTSLGESIEYTIALIQSEPSVLSDYTFSIFMMVAFAALGVFSTLRGVARNG